MPDPERLSAFLDGELDPAETASVEAEVSADPNLAALLARLRAARDATAADPPPVLTRDEAERLDDVVLAALEVTTPLVRPRGAPPGPRRGRSALPYFAAAASLALVLSVGIAVFATSLRPGGNRPPQAGVTETRTERHKSTAPEGAAGYGPAGGAAGPAPGEAAAALTAAAPALYVDAGDLATDDDLARLLAATPTASIAASDARERLAAAAGGLGDYGDLRQCLAGVTDALVPMRVDAGRWKGKGAYFVSGGPRGSPARQVVVLARPRCATLHIYTPG